MESGAKTPAFQNPRGGKMKKVHIYTDGSCLGNPGPGGWAAILTMPDNPRRLEIGGGFRLTTNNRMEILAAAQALARLNEACDVDIYTDSQYLRNAVEKKWLDAWRRANWKKADKKPVLNVDLWQKLLPLLQMHAVSFIWLRGHAGHAENERCDELARFYASQKDLEADEAFEAQRNK